MTETQKEGKMAAESLEKGGLRRHKNATEQGTENTQQKDGRHRTKGAKCKKKSTMKGELGKKKMVASASNRWGRNATMYK